jgi:hypothetical protein
VTEAEARFYAAVVNGPTQLRSIACSCQVSFLWAFPRSSGHIPGADYSWTAWR